MINLAFDKAKVICLTPVKNERWIIEEFLQAVSLWADHIIIADQGSVDGTDAIASAHPKVILVQNDQPFNEKARSGLLIETARKISGPKVLFALDADEFLSANALDSHWIDQVRLLPPGTSITVDLVNVFPDHARYWRVGDRIPCGFVDDGTAYEGTKIHSSRLPWNPRSATVHYDDIVQLHLQYVDWRRMESKHRWYQAWERLNGPSKSPTLIFRTYNHMNALGSKEVKELAPEWLEGYSRRGISVFPAAERIDQPEYWWDIEVLAWINEDTDGRLSRVDIWDYDWTAIGRRNGVDVTIRRGSSADKFLLGWLRRTRRYQRSLLVRLIDRVLMTFGY